MSILDGLTEWERKEKLAEYGLEEISNCRSCANCGTPLIELKFITGSFFDQFEKEKKIDDICTKCAISLGRI